MDLSRAQLAVVRCRVRTYVRIQALAGGSGRAASPSKNGIAAERLPHCQSLANVFVEKRQDDMKMFKNRKNESEQWQLPDSKQYFTRAV